LLGDKVAVGAGRVSVGWTVLVGDWVSITAEASGAALVVGCSSPTEKVPLQAVMNINMRAAGKTRNFMGPPDWIGWITNFKIFLLCVGGRRVTLLIQAVTDSGLVAITGWQVHCQACYLVVWRAQFDLAISLICEALYKTRSQ
jgi:hypothetical protein